MRFPFCPLDRVTEHLALVDLELPAQPMAR